MQMIVQNKNGFTLIELLMAMVTGMIVLAGIYLAFNSQQKINTREQQVVDAAQSVRTAAHFMVREIRLAGMDGTGMAGAGFRVAGPNSIRFTMDRDDDEIVSASEDISYGFADADDPDADGIANSGTAPIKRIADKTDRLAEDIHALHFAYAFDNDGDGELDFVDDNGDGDFDAGEEIWAYDLDGGGDLDYDIKTGDMASPVAFDKIRAVRIWILARTKHPLRGYSSAKSFTLGDQFVPGQNNFKYRLLTTTVKCRNMGT